MVSPCVTPVVKRKKPYTQIGISRVACKRCGEPSLHQWQVCSDGNQYRGLCLRCDVELNKLVLKFFKFENWREMLLHYTETTVRNR